MRLIDAEGSELKTQLKIIREAEYQICGSGSWGFTAKCEHAIEDAHTVHPESHWIPVTKDTPKEANTYMCTCSDAGRRIVTPVKWQPRTKTWNLTGARAYWKVIAWMPMPAPWKGE